jgi:hypothetical protein
MFKDEKNVNVLINLCLYLDSVQNKKEEEFLNFIKDIKVLFHSTIERKKNIMALFNFLIIEDKDLSNEFE